MSILFPVLAVVVAAFVVWLTVRIVNRRERWAKWTAVAMGVVLAYPLSLGPACWISSQTGRGDELVSAAYRPLVHVASHNRNSMRTLLWYARVGSPSHWGWLTVTLPSRQLELRWTGVIFKGKPAPISIPAD